MSSQGDADLVPPQNSLHGDPKLIVYEAPPILVTAGRIAEWLGVTYSAAAKIVYRGDLGPWAKIGRKIIVRSEAIIEAIVKHEKPGWSSWHRTNRTYPRPDPKIMEMLTRPPRQPGSKKQREAEASAPLKERVARWRESGRLKPDPLLAALLNREITQKEYDRLKADRKLGKRIHAALSKSKSEEPAPASRVDARQEPCSSSGRATRPKGPSVYSRSGRFRRANTALVIPRDREQRSVGVELRQPHTPGSTQDSDQALGT